MTIDVADKEIEQFAHTRCANFLSEQSERFEVHKGDPSEFDRAASMAWHSSFLDMKFYQSALIEKGYKVCALFDTASLDGSNLGEWVTLTDRPLFTKETRR